MPTIPKAPKHAPFLSHLAYWLSVGLGSGLSPKAPGTTGSLAALLLLPLWLHLGFWVSLGVIIVAAVAGVWICGRAAHDMGIHDSGHIVWDEWVGQWLTLLPLVYCYDHLAAKYDKPMSLLGIALMTLAAFILFRFFDIIKPWPIRSIDRKVTGGLGIMLDDVLAGIFAAAWVYVLLIII